MCECSAFFPLAYLYNDTKNRMTYCIAVGKHRIRIRGRYQRERERERESPSAGTVVEFYLQNCIESSGYFAVCLLQCSPKQQTGTHSYKHSSSSAVKMPQVTFNSKPLNLNSLVQLEIKQAQQPPANPINNTSRSHYNQ